VTLGMFLFKLEVTVRVESVREWCLWCINDLCLLALKFAMPNVVTESECICYENGICSRIPIIQKPIMHKS